MKTDSWVSRTAAAVAREFDGIEMLPGESAAQWLRRVAGDDYSACDRSDRLLVEYRRLMALIAEGNGRLTESGPRRAAELRRGLFAECRQSLLALRLPRAEVEAIALDLIGDLKTLGQFVGAIVATQITGERMPQRAA